MEKIESTKNTKVKQWKKLLTKKGRTKAKQYIIEGHHLIEEAFKSGASIECLIISDHVELTEWMKQIETNEYFEVSENVAMALSETGTTQGVFAVVGIPEEARIVIDKPYLFLDGVQDPGNVGTLIRSADAAGFGGVVLGEGSADLYNPKTLRSTQGSHFHIAMYTGIIEEWINHFQTAEYSVYGTALDERAVSYLGEKQHQPFGLIVGNEGAGVRAALLELTDKNLYIPIKGQAESLNVAIAGSILMFSLYQ
ncbi:TrmH family RNA methyltransferase [Marinilactibacillus kalidii]|uniref:TrmH family RNA methyltransferase n=1 Tax=Marinilactibacillus kalidii TaxID=2820274 RepID=UPI001ABDA9ED|nr:RNA methyltransferase [Marinilactibacillus kalidii]